MRIIIRAQLRIRYRDFAHRGRGGGPRILAREFTMQPKCLGDLLADGENRVERSHWILKDHRHVVAAHTAHLGVGKLQKVATLKKNLTGDDFSRRRYQPHDRKSRDRFSATAFADQPKQFSTIEIETDTLDRAH